jgi:hypothetical protein
MGRMEMARKERRGLMIVTPIHRFRRHLMKVSGRRFSMHCAWGREEKGGREGRREGRREK